MCEEYTLDWYNLKRFLCELVTSIRDCGGVSVQCSDHWLIVEACVLLSLLALNVYFVAWDDRLRHAELGDKARRVLARLDSKCCCCCCCCYLTNSLCVMCSNWSTLVHRCHK